MCKDINMMPWVVCHDIAEKLLNNHSLLRRHVRKKKVFKSPDNTLHYIDVTDIVRKHILYRPFDSTFMQNVAK